MPNMPQMDHAMNNKKTTMTQAGRRSAESAPKFPRKRGPMKSTGSGPMGKTYEHSTSEGQTKLSSLRK